MAEQIEVLLSEEEVNKKIREIGEQISRTMRVKSYILYVCLRAPAFLRVSLRRELPCPSLWISCPYPVMGVIRLPAES